MSLPQQLKTARMTDSTAAATIDNEVGNLEQAIADILGAPVNTNITAALLEVVAAGLKSLSLQDAAADPTSTFNLRRNATRLKFHDGTNVKTLAFTDDNGFLLVERKLVTVSSTTVTFSGLDGNTDEIYKFIFNFKNGAGSQAVYQFRPNALATNQSVKQWDDSNGGASASDLRFAVAAATSGEVAGDAVFYAKCDPNGQTVRRKYHSRTAESQAGAGTNLLWQFAGTWNETSTNITSIDITSSVASGIGNGSVIELWKVKGS